MTIKELLDKLKYIPTETDVRDCNGDFIYHNFGSDRDNYNNMYISVIEDESEIVETVSELIDLLYEALDYKVMNGYKGGQFEITKDTIVTLGGWGYIGDEILDVTYNDSLCILKCS